MVLDHKPTKVLDRFGTKSLHSRSSGNKEVITVIAAVNVDGRKSVIDIVDSLLDVMLLDVLSNI